MLQREGVHTDSYVGVAEVLATLREQVCGRWTLVQESQRSRPQVVLRSAESANGLRPARSSRSPTRPTRSNADESTIGTSGDAAAYLLLVLAHNVEGSLLALQRVQQGEGESLELSLRVALEHVGQLTLHESRTGENDC